MNARGLASAGRSTEYQIGDISISGHVAEAQERDFVADHFVEGAGTILLDLWYAVLLLLLLDTSRLALSPCIHKQTHNDTTSTTTMMMANGDVINIVEEH